MQALTTIHQTKTLWRGMSVTMLLLFLVITFIPFNVCAGVIDGKGIPDGTCSSEKKYFEIVKPNPGKGLVSSVIKEIKQPLNKVSKQTFEAIAGNAGFQNAVLVATSIYVAVYGIFFMFGMVQVTVHDLMVRLVKIAVLNTLISPSAWQFFNKIVVRFFNGSVDSIIEKVSDIAYSTISSAAAGALTGDPFAPLDNTLVYLVSAKMAVTLMATFMTGPYGFVIGIILAMSLGSFLKALFNALWIYVMALVVRTMMFGLAPLFIVCILFSRTRHLFDGWLNQIVNATFQPIFLFTFFAFFVMLVKSCLEQILQTPVCWMPTQVQSGTPGVSHFWRFALYVCNGDVPALLGNGKPKFQAFDGIWSFDGAQGDIGACNKKTIHPMGILTPLMLWMLADLAGRFNHIVIEIAKDLANASTDLGMGGEGIKKWFNDMTSMKGPEGQGASGATGKRSAPGSVEAISKSIRDAADGAKGNTGTRANPTAAKPPPPPPRT